ncbi:MAG: hypothetical protein ACRD0O_14115 [Acidimicrobiia bacterium]
MTRIKTSIRCILIFMAASLAVAVPPVSAQSASDIAGTWQATALTTTYQPSPTDPTTGSFEGVGSILWQGAWTGVSSFTFRGTVDLVTGASSGTQEDTFAGRSTDGGTGTMSFSSTFTFGPDGHVLARGRIVDATGDFTGARGTLVAEGTAVGGVIASGTYHGDWSRPDPSASSS